MASDSPYCIVGIAGSLRRGSFNRALLRTAQELALERLNIQIHEIGDVPLYNQDIEDQTVPQAVDSLRQAVREADGLLIATPEYNHGVPGILKNGALFDDRVQAVHVRGGLIAPGRVHLEAARSMASQRLSWARRRA